MMDYNENIPMRLREWIDLNKLNYHVLSRNDREFNISKHNLMILTYDKKILDMNEYKFYETFYINWILVINNTETRQIIIRHMQKCIKSIIKFTFDYNIEVERIIDKYYNKYFCEGSNVVTPYLFRNPNCINILKDLLNKKKITVNIGLIIYNSHPYAFELMQKHINQMTHIEWQNLLTCNKNQLDTSILVKNNFHLLDKQSIQLTAMNPYMVTFLEENDMISSLNIEYLSANPNAIDILYIYENLINYEALSSNRNYKAITLLKYNLDKIEDYHQFLMNPAMIDIIEQNTTDKIDYWEDLSLFEYGDDHNMSIYGKWNWLSKNPAAMHILENNQDKINYGALSLNPGIYTYDYDKMKKMKKKLHKEIIQELYKPARIYKYLNLALNVNVEEYLN
jgi:hypothetical protein